MLTNWKRLNWEPAIPSFWNSASDHFSWKEKKKNEKQQHQQQQQQHSIMKYPTYIIYIQIKLNLLSFPKPSTTWIFPPSPVSVFLSKLKRRKKSTTTWNQTHSHFLFNLLFFIFFAPVYVCVFWLACNFYLNRVFHSPHSLHSRSSCPNTPTHIRTCNTIFYSGHFFGETRPYCFLYVVHGTFKVNGCSISASF